MTNRNAEDLLSYLESYRDWLSQITDDDLHDDEPWLRADGLPPADPPDLRREQYSKTLNLAVPGAIYSDEAERLLRHLEDDEARRLAL